MIRKLFSGALEKDEATMEPPSQSSANTPPSSLLQTERLLTKIWQETLGIKQIKREDNFFDLGGDSIVVVRIVNLAAQEGLIIEPTLFMKYSTIAELAAITHLSLEDESDSHE